MPLPVGMAARLGLASLVLLISLKHFFFQHLFGGLASPELPRFAIILAGWLYATLVFLFVLVVIRDIAACILWLAAKTGFSVKPALMAWPFSLSIVLLSLACSTYSLYEAIRLPDVKTKEVRLKRLPSELDGLTIVQITDLHVNAFNPESQVRKVVKTINNIRPDLILLTGDIVDGSPEKRETDIVPLKDLKARYGIYGVVGNHEYYSDYDAWQTRLTGLGIHMLNNAHVTLSIHDAPLVIAGITDAAAAAFGKPIPDIGKALENTPENTVRILLAHRPKNAEIHAKAGIDLQLSGHTHGGQIIGFDRIVAHFNENLLSGWYDIGNMKLYICPGTSLWNGFPARFGVPSEIPVFTLRKG
ncbi:MAG: metallophosphoesterase [Alistipes senegalensis]|nr:metallophosphoesterase [Oxalobacter formigenes]MCM1281713.1 metallophosphoesterase [Alistipes senegalensis]